MDINKIKKVQLEILIDDEDMKIIDEVRKYLREGGKPSSIEDAMKAIFCAGECRVEELMRM